MTVMWNDLCGLVRVAVNEGLWARGRVYDRQGNGLSLGLGMVGVL